MTTWTPEEQKAHRKLWVEALRSGKYRQTTGCLQNNNGFCCLGVACDVSGLGDWGMPNAFSEVGYTVDGETLGGALPIPVARWLGLRTEGGAYGDSGDDDQMTLWKRNDRYRDPFAQIADLIEAEPDGLIAKPEAV